jgi:hypothetical protein
VSVSGRSLPIRTFVAPARFVGVEDGSGEPVRPHWLWPLAVIRLPLGSTLVRPSAADFTRRRALRRTGPRPPFRALRAEPAPPVRSRARFRGERVASDAASRGSHDRSDASLEVSSPSALAGHVALFPGDAIAPAIPLRPLACVATSFAVMLREHLAPTHWRTPAGPCGFALWPKLARPTLHGSKPRVLIGTLRRSTRH